MGTCWYSSSQKKKLEWPIICHWKTCTSASMMTSTAPLTGIIQPVDTTIHFFKPQEKEKRRDWRREKLNTRKMDRNFSNETQHDHNRSEQRELPGGVLDIQHSLPRSTDSKRHNDTTMKTRWQRFQDMHHVHASLDPNAKFGRVKHSSAQDARKLSCIQSTAAAETTACLLVSFHHETPLCTDGSSSYLENIIIVIMYSFRCYFSKLEHIAHYKAKNQTQSKQTSASTRTAHPPSQ